MIPIIILVITLIVYLPLAISLLYVWWRFGKGEIKVAIARAIFLLGSISLFCLMIII
ncbi:MAG: hypothetical protein NTW35_02795 [Candidatus Nomurabacteria bacterium]|nr:hypothetical protein [Candidatus Nomurabacteria bacterium]